MEKILNDEEKIRRAEEIYFRRNNQSAVLRKNNVKKNSIAKGKLLFDLLVMFNLAVIIFCIQNKDYIFTKEFIESLDKYNNKLSLEIIDLFKNIIGNKEAEEKFNEQQNESEIAENEKQQNKKETVGSEIQKEISVIENNISTSSMNEMELDIQNLKGAYKFSLPLNKGIVSSSFGARESKYQKVTGYHTGIDIAAEEGTDIVAAMEGIVEIVSSEGDYGKHIKIRCNNVYTLYAHCSKIFVKEGQIVARGQKIANVGNTGNSTGPHLHFEIRVDDRFVDPARIIDF